MIAASARIASAAALLLVSARLWLAAFTDPCRSIFAAPAASATSAPSTIGPVYVWLPEVVTLPPSVLLPVIVNCAVLVIAAPV